MAQLPIIIERQPVGALELPRQRVSGGQAAFGALGEFGRTIAEAEERRRRVDNILEASRRDAELGQMFTDVEIEASKTKSSKEILPLWNESIDNLKRTHLESIANPELKAHMTAVFNRRVTNSYSRVRGLETKKWLDEGRADFFSLYNESLRELGKMEPGSIPYQLEQRKIDSRIEALDNEGFFSQQEIAKLKQDRDHQVDLQRGFYLLETNSRKLKDSLTPENFPYLTGAEREMFRNHANAEISAAEVEARRLERERIDTVNKDFLQLSLQNKLTVRQVLTSPIPFEAQRFWVDRLEAIRNARKKEKDPFEISDPRVKGPTLVSILREPEKWSVEKITSMMGRGLSIADTLQAVTLHDRTVKDRKIAPEQFTPLHQTLDSLERMRKSFAFTPEGMSGEEFAVSPDLQLKNDQAAQRVMDELLRKVESGADPVETLNQLMKPYFDQKVEGWFSRMMGGVSSLISPPAKAAVPQSQTPEQALFEYDLENRARDYLKRNGKAITPDTLQKTKEFLRKRR